MTFDQWYFSKVGVTVEGARERGGYDIDLMKQCWEAAVKQAREDALEEAMQSLVALKDRSLAAQTKDAKPMTFADDVNKNIRLATVLLAGAIDAIKSLKGKT